MTIGVGIKYILDDREFRNKIRSSNREAERLTRTNRRHLKTIKNINMQEKRSISTKKRELSLINKQTRALERQDRTLKKSSRTRRVAGGRMVGGGMMGLMRGALPVLGVAAIGSAAIGAYKGAASRQSGWTQVSNMLGHDISGATKKDVMNIAVKTAQDNKDVITAYYDALSAGFSEEAGKAVTKAAGIFATGGNFDIATAQSALLTTMETFKDLSPDEVINLLAGTVKAGRVNERQVATNVGQFMASGASLGISAKEQLAAFAGISKSLGNADEAGTALGALFTALQKATPAAINMGIDANLVKEKGLQGVLNKLAKELEGKDAAGKAEIISDVFGNVRAKKGLFAFLNDPNSLKQLGDVVGSGNAMDNFKRANDDAERQFQKLATTTQQLTDSFFEATGLLDDLASAFGTVASILGYFSSDDKEDKEDKTIKEIEEKAKDRGAVIRAKERESMGIGTAEDVMVIAAANQGGTLLPEGSGERMMSIMGERYMNRGGLASLTAKVGLDDARLLRKQYLERDVEGMEEVMANIFSEDAKENSRSFVNSLSDSAQRLRDINDDLARIRIAEPDLLDKGGPILTKQYSA